MLQNLVIDWGNSRVKLALFRENKMLKRAVWSDVTTEALIDFCGALTELNILLCSVTSASDEFENLFRARARQFVKLNHHTPVPLKIAYDTPDTLGFDRLANAVAASHKVSDGYHALVIDAGTCLKFDFVHAEKGYLGGAISPGLLMRYRALHRDTHALPLPEKPQHTALTGKSTLASIHSGVVNGMIAEIKGITDAYRSQYSPLLVFLTGGDNRFFDGALKNDIFAHDFLTLTGLNDILEYNLYRS